MLLYRVGLCCIVHRWYNIVLTLLKEKYKNKEVRYIRQKT